MGRKEVCSFGNGITRIEIHVDQKGRCYPKATGDFGKKLQKALDENHGVIVKPTWLMAQLQKVMKEDE